MYVQLSSFACKVGLIQNLSRTLKFFISLWLARASKTALKNVLLLILKPVFTRKTIEMLGYPDFLETGSVFERGSMILVSPSPNISQLLFSDTVYKNCL